MNRIEEGTYGVVYRAKDKRTGLGSAQVEGGGGVGDNKVPGGLPFASSKHKGVGAPNPTRDLNKKLFFYFFLIWKFEKIFSFNFFEIFILDEIVALKRLKMEKEREGFPITSLREINTLLKAQHPNIVTVRVKNKNSKRYFVFFFVENFFIAQIFNRFLFEIFRKLLLAVIWIKFISSWITLSMISNA